MNQTQAHTTDPVDAYRLAMHEKIEAQLRVRLDRIRLLSDARDLIRRAGIRNNCELLAVLQTVQASVGPYPIHDTTLNTYSTALLELVCDYDSEWNPGEQQ